MFGVTAILERSISLNRIIERYNGQLWGGSVATRVEKLSDSYMIWCYKEFSSLPLHHDIATIRKFDNLFQLKWKDNQDTEVFSYENICSELDAKIRNLINQFDDD